MSTRGTIVVKLKDEDLGKTVKVDPSKFKGINQYEAESYAELCGEVKLDGKYISAYCHHDNYVSGTGYDLMRGWNNYNMALNLVLGGDMSSISEEMAAHYVATYKEKWKDDKPKLYDELPPITEEYQYLFQNGEWYVRSIHGLDDFVPVKDVDVFEKKRT